jgi:hypothetical protein
MDAAPTRRVWTSFIVLIDAFVNSRQCSGF